MVAADAVMLVALASTVLSLDAHAARTKVLLYLSTTLAPFSVLAPLIGPLVDRMAGGRRLVVQIAAAGRAVVSVLLAVSLHSLWLYPLALAALILKQTYLVSRSALVPSVTSSEADLVEANSKLGMIAGLAAAAAVVPAGILQHFSPGATLVLSAVGFVVALFYANQLPREVVAPRRADRIEQVELRSPPVVLGASAMVLLRASVGFMQFHLFFWLRGRKEDAWFGAAIALGAVASMLGNAVGPAVRRVLREEVMVICALGFVAVSGIACAVAGGPVTGVVLMSTVNFGAAVGRLAFDSIVQRDAPAANQGRAFAKFESRFQLAWVLAAIPPVLWTPPGQVGFAVVGAIAAFAAVTYLLGMRAVRHGRPVPVTISRRAGREIKRRIDERRTPAAGSPRPVAPPDRRLASRPPPTPRGQRPPRSDPY